MYNLGTRREFHLRFSDRLRSPRDRHIDGVPGRDRASPAPDRSAIDVNEIRSGIVADAAALQASCRFAHLLQASPLGQKNYRLALDVKAVFGPPFAAQTQSHIGSR